MKLLGAWLLSFGAIVSAPALAEMQIIRLCNKGTIDVAVATVEETRAILGFGALWEATGWTWVEADDCSNVFVSSVATNRVINVVLGVRTRSGAFGVIQRVFNKGRIVNWQKTACVSADRFSIDDNVVPPCVAPYREVPTSGGFWMSGDFTWNLEVQLSEADLGALDVALTGPDAGLASTPSSTSVAPALPGFWESVASAWNETEAKKNALARSCAQADVDWTVAERESHCTCMVGAALNSLDDTTVQNLAKAWTQENLEPLQRFTFSAPEYAKCPPLPRSEFVSAYAASLIPLSSEQAQALWSRYRMELRFEERPFLGGKKLLFAWVTRLHRAGLAARADLQIDDVLVQVGDRPIITDPDTLAAAIDLLINHRQPEIRVSLQRMTAPDRFRRFVDITVPGR